MYRRLKTLGPWLLVAMLGSALATGCAFFAGKDVSRPIAAKPDYRFEPCPVDVKLVDGHATPVGDVEIRAIDTPGHCAGHMCFTMEQGGRTTLFSGDNVFSGGKILLQPLPDCDLQAHLRSIEKLVDLGVEVFLPGHGSISLKDGQRHIDEAMSWTKRGLVPPSLL